MFHVRYRELYLSIAPFPHSRVYDIFAAARGPYRKVSMGGGGGGRNPFVGGLLKISHFDG